MRFALFPPTGAAASGGQWLPSRGAVNCGTQDTGDCQGQRDAEVPKAKL